MAAQKLLQGNQAEAAQQQAEQEAQNPLTQIQMKELEIKDRAQTLKETIAQHEMALEKAKLELDMANKTANIEVQRERIAAEDEREGARVGVRLATQIASNNSAETREAMKAGTELSKEAVKGRMGRNSGGE
jgi:MarR-like DNA-binding transcriptional regulator SgrR of sgrS sRNA